MRSAASLHALALLAGLSSLAASPPPRSEARVFFDGLYRPEAPEAVVGSPALFVRTEQRFGEARFVYAKSSLGVRLALGDHLALQPYYARVDNLYGAAKIAHLAVLDVLGSWKLGAWHLGARLSAERHAPGDFYRLRACPTLGWQTPLTWLEVWASDEQRYDTDLGEVSMQNFRAGASIALSEHTHLKIYGDYEMTRRGLTSWAGTQALSTSLVLRL